MGENDMIELSQFFSHDYTQDGSIHSEQAIETEIMQEESTPDSTVNEHQYDIT
ncbi:hypothetical protein U1Q18_013017, partial [Sarracenia purpurea var. burkii]